ncbi:transglutaminase family protein [bacterium]|nr:MAG: transglutaminase family protein [bacterium]
MHSHQMLRLTPRDMPHQTTLSQQVAITPQPVARVDTEDAFGNPVVRVQIDRPHDALIVDAHMEIEVRMRPPRKAEDSQPWRGLRESLRYSAQALTVEELEVRRYLSESPYVRIKRRFSEFAADCFPSDAPVLACAEKLMHKIHAEFTYAPGETEVATPLVEVLGQKRGVCQDYSHVMIACLRAQGLAARYVSGYLRTMPLTNAPVEEAGLVGADASHAWISVWAPPFGWVALDPTNDRRVGRDHVTLAWGRDFGDVSPLRGVILGGGSHELTVNVSVRPLPVGP